MSKYNMGNISPEDVLDYTQAVQSMYGIAITIQLVPAVAGAKGQWQINAVAWKPGFAETLESATTRMVTYPSVHHKTFPGACLGAVMHLEQALQAHYHLMEMEARHKST